VVTGVWRCELSFKSRSQDDVKGAWGRLKGHIQATHEGGPYYYLKEGQELKLKL